MNVSYATIIFAGLLANLIMQMTFFFVQYASDTTQLNQFVGWQEYIGCLLTGQLNTLKSFITMLVATSIIAIGLSFGFAWLIKILWGYSNYKIGMLVAVPLWAINGLLLPIADSINPCVEKHLINPLGLFGFGQSVKSGIVFFIAHLVFGAVIGQILS